MAFLTAPPTEPSVRSITRLPAKDNVQIAPADGKLGVLIPGMGAVSTTFMAGVEAVKRGLAQPVGSLTQLATIRLGKRTDGRSPLIKDFVPLAGLNDLVFRRLGHFRRQRLRSRGQRASAGAVAAGAGEGSRSQRDQADEGGVRSTSTSSASTART